MKDKLGPSLVSNWQPPNRTGAQTTYRYSYQHDWTLALLIELDRAEDQYLVLCDFLDDAVVVDNPTPSLVRFYQVKTKASGVRDPAEFLRRSPSPQSVLAKLCSHLDVYGSVVDRVHVVSNIPFKLTLTTGERVEDPGDYALEEVCDKDRQKILKKLQKELPSLDQQVLAASLNFSVSELPLAGHRTHIRGVLADRIQELFPNANVNIHGLYVALAQLVLSKSEYAKRARHFADIAQFKGIAVSEFRRYIVDAVGSVPDVDAWPDVRAMLAGEGWSAPSIARLKGGWDRLRACSMATPHAFAEYEGAAEGIFHGQTFTTLSDAISYLDTSLRATRLPPLFQQEEHRALCARVIYNAWYQGISPSPPVNPGSTP